MMKAHPKNKLVGSPAYVKILTQYNELLQLEGPKINNKKFWQEKILPEIPGYHLQSWYKFLERFKTEAGIMEAKLAGSPAEVQAQSIGPSSVTSNLPRIMLSNQAATASMIQSLLNIGADRARLIAEHPESLTHAEAVKLSLAAMKAQDSRIHAIGKIREDDREQEKFDRAFSGSASE